MFDVSEALDDELTVPFEVERYTGDYVNGVYKTTLETKFTSTGVITAVANATGVLPDAERHNVVFKIISSKELRAVNSNTNTIGDVVVYRQQRYRIIKPGDNTAYGYSRAWGVLDDAGKYN